MARVKISEYKAKRLLYQELGFPLEILSVNLLNLDSLGTLNSQNKYVVKVDQGIKRRFKKGLVALDKKKSEIGPILKEFSKKGYSSFFIEEFIPHKIDDELYFSIERVRSGKRILYSKKGGVNIENDKELIKQDLISSIDDLKKISDFLNLDLKFITNLLAVFDRYYFSFLEINPLVIQDNKIKILDLAVEVDSTAEFFVENAWDSSDFISEEKKTKEEKEVLELSQKSQAAFKLDLINPNGSVFMLLSGGGASIVLADEVFNQGESQLLANYGEYSGNPSQEETYLYTRSLLNLLIKSKSKRRVLIIGGGVANFTDIRITFRGVIKALEEFKSSLSTAKVKVFVRRGGPHQKEGLLLIEDFLKKQNLLGIVAGPEMILTDVVSLALKYLKYD